MSQPDSWLKISVLGSTAGLIAAGLTYTATQKASSAAAVASSLTVTALGEIASLGTKYFFGDAASVAVRLVTSAASKTTEETVRQGGILTAAVAGAAAGATTALTITVGGHVVNYSIEYGGKLSKDLAEKFSEMYVMYKLGHAKENNNNDIEVTGIITTNENGEWLLLEEKEKEKEKEKDEINLNPSIESIYK
jgi:hypothetical protein